MHRVGKICEPTHMKEQERAAADKRLFVVHLCWTA
jgi:hypothetical protein